MKIIMSEEDGGEEKKQDTVESGEPLRRPLKEVLTAEERKKKRNARKSLEEARIAEAWSALV